KGAEDPGERIEAQIELARAELQQAQRALGDALLLAEGFGDSSQVAPAKKRVKAAREQLEDALQAQAALDDARSLAEQAAKTAQEAARWAEAAQIGKPWMTLANAPRAI